jgi:LPS sulfotransferase NodH
MSKYSEKNKKELDPSRDFGADIKANYRYCILSSPRSGSTLLGRMLYETRMAGDPQEYLNPRLLAYERDRTNNQQMGLQTFLNSIQKRRTSPNGVFGIKSHYHQLLGALRITKPDERTLKWLKQYQGLVWIRRRDRIAQAVSQAVGLATQVWSSEDPKYNEVKNTDLKLSDAQLFNALSAIGRDDLGWESLIKAGKLEVLEVWYEDLAANYAEESMRVIRYLGLEDQVPNIPPPPLEKQSSPQNEKFARQLLDFLGANKAP